jgi:carbamoyl-phosphate synthase large subunit
VADGAALVAAARERRPARRADSATPSSCGPAFTLGGHGGGFAYTGDELRAQVARGLRESPTGQVLLEESILGWKEFELEVIRDSADNVVVVCSIENLDPMGVHTGDSVTVAPADDAHRPRATRSCATPRIAIIRAVGVDTGGSNIQFAVDPRPAQVVVIEMNPRVSRSSALASKATGYPIAKIAAKLAVGYRLDELPNDITRTTPASFEPTLDYVVVKCRASPSRSSPAPTDPRHADEVGRRGDGDRPHLREALQKALRSRELDAGGRARCADARRRARATCTSFQEATRDRVHVALLRGRRGVGRRRRSSPTTARLRSGSASRRRARRAAGAAEAAVRGARLAPRRPPGLRRSTPAPASSRRARRTTTTRPRARGRDAAGARTKVVILGSGPNRIGQGIEFDYCCVHASIACRELGLRGGDGQLQPGDRLHRLRHLATGSTSSRSTLEDVLRGLRRASAPRSGVVVQFGGQTPLKLARAIEEAGVPILGTPPTRSTSPRTASASPRCSRARPALARAARSPARPRRRVADRRRDRLPGARAPRRTCSAGARWRSATTTESLRVRRRLDRGEAGIAGTRARRPLPRDAIEVDVDALCDGASTPTSRRSCSTSRRPASTPATPPACCPRRASRSAAAGDRADRAHPRARARRRRAAQRPVRGDRRGQVYVIEANPRASRTVPFVAQGDRRPLVQAACRLSTGLRLADLGLPRERPPRQWSVKAAVLPFARFPGSDPVLGPEMRSTGEVMASAGDLPTALAKAERAAGRRLPTSGAVFLSIRPSDQPSAVPVAATLAGLGFKLYATVGTAGTLARAGIEVEAVRKLSEGDGGEPTVLDLIRRGSCDLVVNTPEGRNARSDGYAIREAALSRRVPCITTLSGAAAAVHAIANARAEQALSLQERIDAEQRTA